MKGMAARRHFTLAVLVVGLALCAWLFWGKPAPQPTAIKATSAPMVDVFAFQPQSLQLLVNTQGTIQPRRQIDLIAQVAGKVESVADSFAEGGFFARDQVLVQLEQQDYRFAAQRARAAVADAEQLLAMEKGRVRQAKREWRDLGDADANALFLRKPQLASAEAALDAARADLEQAQLQLQRTTLRAPFAGRVLEQFVDRGEYLPAGSAVARIHSTDSVEVRLPLSDRQVAMLDLSYGQDDSRILDIPVRLSGRFGGRDWEWQGTITRTDASIDSSSRVIYVVAEIAEPFLPDAQTGRPPLMIGQFVRAQISGRMQDDAVVLPRHALRPEDRVWLLDENNHVHIKQVTVLQSDVERVTVVADFGGLNRVVVSTLNLVTEGMPVTPQPEG